tara:strand:+ start:6445 stop:7692 length:1248 start_codon:yes stop_codon:yes gene_type:complete
MGMNALTQTFLDLISIETSSFMNQKQQKPSYGQVSVLNIINQELQAIVPKTNIKRFNTHGIFAEIPASVKKTTIPTIGLVVQTDSTPALSSCLKPVIFEKYNPKNRVHKNHFSSLLNEEELSFLNRLKNNYIISSDGRGVLGTESKAAISIVLHAIKAIVNDKGKHGKIQLLILTDSYSKKNIQKAPLSFFTPDLNYTVEGGELGNIYYKSRELVEAEITIRGNYQQYGTIEEGLISALELTNEFINALPMKEDALLNDQKKGRFHLDQILGDSNGSQLKLIIEDLDKNRFAARLRLLSHIADQQNKLRPNSISIQLKNRQYSIEEHLKSHWHFVDFTVRAAINKGLNKQQTIGSHHLSNAIKFNALGIPTIGLFTGGVHQRTKREYISVQHMEKAVDFIQELVYKASKQKKASK